MTDSIENNKRRPYSLKAKKQDFVAQKALETHKMLGNQNIAKPSTTPRLSEIIPKSSTHISLPVSTKSPLESQKKIGQEITKLAQNRSVEEKLRLIFKQLKPIVQNNSDTLHDKMLASIKFVLNPEGKEAMIADPISAIKFMKTKAPSAFKSLLHWNPNKTLIDLVNLIEIDENHTKVAQLVTDINKDKTALLSIETMCKRINREGIPLESFNVDGSIRNIDEILNNLMKTPHFEIQLAHNKNPKISKYFSLIKENNAGDKAVCFNKYLVDNKQPLQDIHTPPLSLEEKTDSLIQKTSKLSKLGVVVKTVGKVAMPIVILLGVLEVMKKHKDNLAQEGEDPEKKQQAIADYHKDLGVMLINLGASIPDTAVDIGAFSNELLKNEGNIIKTIKEFDSNDTSKISITNLLRKSGITDYAATQFTKLFP